ncbi:MAG: NAD(P)/FAD-dependent oxidoreductase [Lachnospiraceae bacterium]|nr:NAD(P)/FAD-dependent oxidoreductase [Lachnospiraceae bacterium]
MAKKKVLIIGAGPAGITAGFELLSRSEDYQVLILEESGKIGGISRTVRYKGNRMDIGGHRFFSKDSRVSRWWDERMPRAGAAAYDYKKLGRETALVEGGPDPEKEDRVMLTRNRVSRIYYKKKFFDYPVRMNVNTIRNMGFFTTAKAGCSYLGSVVRKLPEDSLENFYINRFGRKLYSMFFEGYTEKLWGRHPREISADWGSQRVKGLSIKAILLDIAKKAIPALNNGEVETSLIEEFFYPKFGPGQLWEAVAHDFIDLGGEIRMHARVARILTEDGRARGLVYVDEAGNEHMVKGDYVISSMPLKDLILAMNDVPAGVREVAEGLPYRDFVTVGLLVDRLNLKNETKIPTLNNIIPDNWIYVQDTGVKLGRIQIFNNWSPYMVKDPDHTVWIGLEYFCAEGDEYWNMPNKKWKSMAVRELKKMGVISGIENVIDAHCERVKKAYPAYFDTYSRIDEIIGYLDGFDNLFCVGRNGQHRYNNMDHSMETSFQTVDNILSGKKDKTNIWNVNTEKDYHEEK